MAINLLLLINLFWSYFKIGLFSFGGGYAMIPLMELEVIARHGWLTAAEFIDIIALAESTPGPIAINSATYVGFSMAGICGSIVATLGVISPTLILLLTLSNILMKVLKAKSPPVENIIQGLRPAVIVLILSAALSLGKTGLVDWVTFAIATTLFFGSILFKANPLYLIAAGAVLGLIFYPY